MAATAWSNTPSLLTDSSCRSRSPSMCTIQAKFFDGVNLCRCLGSRTALVHSTTNLRRLTSSLTISWICGCISGSPPARDTIGAPHSSTAATACSTGIRRLSSEAGCWIFPQPTHLRLHANSGSTSTIMGNFGTPRSFIFIRCVPSLIERCNGKPIVYSFTARRLGPRKPRTTRLVHTACSLHTVCMSDNTCVTPTRRDEHVADTRQALVDAARTLFTEQGYAATGTEEIVAAARVTRGALYHHFHDKTDVFRAVMEQIAREVAEHLIDAELSRPTGPSPGPSPGQPASRPPADAWDEVRDGLRAFLDLCVVTDDFQRIVLVEGPAVLGREV